MKTFTIEMFKEPALETNETYSEKSITVQADSICEGIVKAMKTNPGYTYGGSFKEVKTSKNDQPKEDKDKLPPLVVEKPKKKTSEKNVFKAIN